MITETLRPALAEIDEQRLQIGFDALYREQRVLIERQP